MDPVAFLEDFVSIPSPSGQEDQAAAFLAKSMSKLRFRTHRDSVGNVVGEIGPADAKQQVLLVGHVDTVPGTIPVRRKGGTLHGRGSVDAKASLAAFVLAAANAVPRMNAPFKIVVVGAVEEESNGRGAHHLAATLGTPSCVVIGEPSGWEGVTLGYKGMLAVIYRLALPTAHSARDLPGPAASAVSFWNEVMTYAEQRNRGRSGHFDTLDPALREFNTLSDGLQDRVEMHIAVRLPPQFESEALHGLMMQWAQEATLETTCQDHAYQAEKNTPLVRAMLRSIRAEGGHPRFKLKTGTSDMNVLAPSWDCPFVAYGPGDSSLDHTPEERIEEKEYLRSIRVLTRLLTDPKLSRQAP